MATWNRAAPWYYGADGELHQAVDSGDGWEYPLAPVGEDGREVQLLENDSPEQNAMVNERLTQLLGYNPNDRQVNEDGSRGVQIMGPNGYELGVITEDGQEMPLSLARQSGKQIISAMRDPKPDSGGLVPQLKDMFVDSGAINVLAAPFTAGLGGMVGNALGTSAAVGSGIVGAGKALLTGGNPILGGLMGYGGSMLGGGSGEPTVTATDGASPTPVSSYNVTDGSMDIDWGQGLDLGGYDTSFLTDPSYAGGYNFDTMPTYADYYGTGGGDIARLMGGQIDLSNSSEYLPYTLSASDGSGLKQFGTSTLKALLGSGGTSLLPALLAGGGSVLSGYMGSNAARDAAQIGADSSAAGIAEARRQYDQSRADTLPFLQTGTAANKRLGQLLGVDDQYTGADSGYLTRRFTSADMEADPVYQSGLKFGLDEGTKGINQRALAGGSYDSGATLKALTRFGNDYASTKANDSYNRFSNDQGNIFSRLTGTSGGGQTAAGQVTAAGNAMTGAVNNANDNAASARAAGIVGGNNAWGQALGGVANAAQSYQTQSTLDRILQDRENERRARGF